MMAMPFLTFAGFAVPEGEEITLAEIQNIIETIAQFLIVISIVIAVIFIIWGGIRYMASGEDKKAAKATIWNGIIGAAVVLAVGVILNTVASLVTRTFFG